LDRGCRGVLFVVLAFGDSSVEEEDKKSGFNITEYTFETRCDGLENIGPT